MGHFGGRVRLSYGDRQIQRKSGYVVLQKSSNSPGMSDLVVSADVSNAWSLTSSPNVLIAHMY
jgi:hypothetical protein